MQSIKSKYAVVLKTAPFSHLQQKICAEEMISCSFLQEISLPPLFRSHRLYFVLLDKPMGSQLRSPTFLQPFFLSGGCHAD